MLTQEKARIKQVNHSLFMLDMMQISPVYIPLLPPIFDVNLPIGHLEKPFVYSSFMAAAIDSLTVINR